MHTILGLVDGAKAAGHAHPALFAVMAGMHLRFGKLGLLLAAEWVTSRCLEVQGEGEAEGDRVGA